MSGDLQTRFRELAKGCGVYVGGKFATQNDLSALFTARAATLYLRGSGRIAFVLPLAALTRGQFERLRSGSYHTGAIQWDEAWTMDDTVQPLFPVPACAVFGRRRATSKPMPDTVRAYTGALPMRDAPEALVDKLIASKKFGVMDGRRNRPNRYLPGVPHIARRFAMARVCSLGCCVSSSARRWGGLASIWRLHLSEVEEIRKKRVLGRN